MRDIENEYWDIHDLPITALGSGVRYIQQAGNPSYVRFVEDDDGSTTFLINLKTNDPFHPASDYDKWKHTGILRLYTTLNTDASSVYADAGDTVDGIDGEIIVPTAEEWNAMTAEEREQNYERYYFKSQDGRTIYGLRCQRHLGHYYSFSFAYGIAESDNTQTYTEGGVTGYYDHRLYGSPASNYSQGRLNLTNPDGEHPVFRELTFYEGKPWLITTDEDYPDGRTKCLILTIYKTEYTRYWKGYNNNGVAQYTYTSQSDSVSTGDVICDVHCLGQYIDGVHNDGYPYCQNFKNIDKKLWSEPYPDYMWETNPEKNWGYPQLKMMDYAERLGAFANCPNLQVVVIPKTVKNIGEYTFIKSALTAATIARDCEFSETSFPPRCIINYYND